MYEFVVYLHILFVALYLLHFTVRIFYLMKDRHERLFLFTEKSRLTHGIVVTLLAISGLYLGFTYDFAYGSWFVVKLGFIIFIVFMADYAFRNYLKWAGILAYAVYLYTILMSFFKPFGLPF